MSDNCHANANVLTVIYQGDQYYLPIKLVSKKGNVITPENIDGLMIKIGNITKQISDGGLEFSGENWLFPLKQEETIAWIGNIKCQAKYKQGNIVHTSPEYYIRVDPSGIKELFDIQ